MPLKGLSLPSCPAAAAAEQHMDEMSRNLQVFASPKWLAASPGVGTPPPLVLSSFLLGQGGLAGSSHRAE